MSSTNNPSISVLKNNTGASKVGTANGDTVEDRIVASDNNIATLQGETAQHATDLTAQDGRLDVLEADSAQHQIDIAANAAAVGVLQAENTSQENRIDALELADQNGGNLKPRVESTFLNATSSQSVLSNVEAQILNMSCSITPQLVTSKVRVDVRWSGEASIHSKHNISFRLYRNGVSVGSGQIAANRPIQMSPLAVGHDTNDAASTMDGFLGFHLDSPNSDQQVNYELRVHIAANMTLYTNRTVKDLDGAGYERASSEIILTEVLA